MRLLVSGPPTRSPLSGHSRQLRFDRRAATPPACARPSIATFKGADVTRRLCAHCDAGSTGPYPILSVAAEAANLPDRAAIPSLHDCRARSPPSSTPNDDGTLPDSDTQSNLKERRAHQPSAILFWVNSRLPYSEVTEIGRGGMAAVYEALHERTGERVALKRPMPWEGCDDRLRREADVLSKFDHPHIMQIIDHGTDDHDVHWYAMPVARGSLSTIWSPLADSRNTERVCRQILRQAGAGLDVLHEAGYVHRDVKPGNILAFADPSFSGDTRWVISDLGLVRRPPGETTNNPTGSASVLGTLGYIAPEVHGDPHDATAAADVYSLGRILAWMLTGETPVLTEPLLPQGRWRGVVREFTHRDPLRRPQTIARAIERADELLADLPISTQAEFIVAVRARNQVLTAQDPLWDVALENLSDHGFVIDDLVEVSEGSAFDFAQSRPNDAARAGEEMAQHLVRGDWGRRSFDFANRHLAWIQAILRGLLEVGREDLFEDVCAAYVEAVSTWNRFAHNDRLGRWLRRLPEPAGIAAARAIRQAGVRDFFSANFGDEYQDFASATLGATLRP